MAVLNSKLKTGIHSLVPNKLIIKLSIDNEFKNYLLIYDYFSFAF